MDTADAGVVLAQPILPSSIRENETKIQSIQIEDLIYLEKDLDFEEKVSLVFLLCAQDKIRAKVMLQYLILGSHHPDDETNYLYVWAHENASLDWRNKFLDGLCVIQANHIIRKLGLNQKDLEERYLPHVPEKTLFLHPIVKILYYVCEQLTTDETHKLIEYITSNNESIQTQSLNFQLDSSEHLEVHLLHWITEEVLDVGEERSRTSQGTNQGGYLQCNLQPIIDFLKLEEIVALGNTVKNATSKFNLLRQPYQMDNNEATGSASVESYTSIPEIPRLEIFSDLYLIRRKNAGFVLIINQHTFTQANDNMPKLKTRIGTDKDRDSLKKTLSSFGYKIKIKNNLPSSKILEAIDKLVERSVTYDSVIVCILSHGYEGVVYGSDSVPVRIKDIQNRLMSPLLLEKPKILIIQACQGDETQEAMHVPEPIQVDPVEADGDSPIYFRQAPKFSDYIVCLSTVPGFISFRHTEHGSWYIQILCERLNELGDRYELQEILRRVNADVMLKKGIRNQCMVPESRVALRKMLFLPKRF